MLDLTKELDELLKDDHANIIIRHATDLKCNCWRDNSKTPDPNCPRCDGMGWIFNEWIQDVMHFSISTGRGVAHQQDFNYGRSYSNTFTFYCIPTDKTLSIKNDDVIFEIKADVNGDVHLPITRLRKWTVTDVVPMKADNNVIKFIKVLTKPVVA